MSDLPTIAEQVSTLVEQRFTQFDDYELQALCIAEEVGEFIGALRRFLGKARRPGNFTDVRNELADATITVYVMACMLDVDLDAAVTAKLNVIMARPWKQEMTNDAGVCDCKDPRWISCPVWIAQDGDCQHGS